MNFISSGFAGRTDDVTICEKSGFFDCIDADSMILADKGFRIAPHVGFGRLQVPARKPNLKGFSAHELYRSRLIAVNRIFIEMMIGRIRFFKVLQENRFRLEQADFVDKIVHVCAFLASRYYRPQTGGLVGPLDNSIQ